MTRTLREFLDGVGLGRYLDAFETNDIHIGLLARLTDQDLRELGMVSLGHRKVMLEAAATLTSPARPHAERTLDVTGLPTIIALPIQEFRLDTHPVLKLWHACDALELTLRLAVMIGLADIRRRTVPRGLLGELRSRIEEPTLGKWKAMAAAVARLASSGDAVFPELPALVNEVLVPLLDGPSDRRTPENSLAALRNRLAHGGGITRATAAKLVAIWTEPFEEALSRAAWLAELALVVQSADGTYGALRGPGVSPPRFIPPDPSVAQALKVMYVRGDEVALVRGGVVLPLWPLTLYGTPRLGEPSSQSPGEPVTQVYVRRGETCLQFTPIGSDDVSVSESDESAKEEFLRIFHLTSAFEESTAHPLSVRGFESDMRRDAERLIGRADELARVHTALSAALANVMWISGLAGMGKSYLVARIVAELEEQASERTLVLPYRFRLGDDRCSRDQFLSFAIERLETWSGVALRKCGESDRQEKPLERLRSMLASIVTGHRLILILDGLDEIAEVDEKFADQIPIGLGFPGVTWLCAGRPERGLPEVFTPERCLQLFPAEEGLPPMREQDIRTMLLEKIGPLRRRLLHGDRDHSDRSLFGLNANVGRDLAGCEKLPEPIREEFLARGILLGVNHHLTANDETGEWTVSDQESGETFAIRSGSQGVRVYGDRVTNPFVERVAQCAAGLPLYVTYVVGDILSNRLRALDAGERLPSSLSAYNEELLRRCGISRIAQVVTPLVSLLAIAREPLTVHQITEVLRERTIVPDDRARAPAMVRDGISAMASMIRRGSTPESGEGYTLYHHSLRQHLLETSAMRDPVDTATAFLNRKVARVPVPDDSELRQYVFRHGVEHLVQHGEYAAAVDLLHHLSERQDLEPHVARTRLRHFAKLLSIGLKVCSPQQAIRIEPSKLELLLLGFYEIEPLYGGIRVLVDHHIDAWPAIRGRLLESEDFVVRYTMALASADVFCTTRSPWRLADLVALTEHEDINHRELGWYALKLVYARDPAIIDPIRLESLAGSESYADRMILGELLLNLAYQHPGIEPRRLVTNTRFWDPVWDYNRLDVWDLNAARHFFDGRRLPDEGVDEGTRRAFTNVARTEQLRTEVLELAAVRQEPTLRAIFERYYVLPLEMERIREAESALRRTPELDRVMRVLFSHPLWDVTENAGSILASIAELNPAALTLIRRLVGDPYWRVRYAAIEAAFGARFIDQTSAFSEAVHQCYDDENSRVRGLCAENLTAWVLYAPAEERAVILGRFIVEVQRWVQDDDAWLLEHIYQLFRELTHSGHDCSALLSRGLSPLLAGEPAWYDLDREGFLHRIEARKVGGH